MLVASLWAPGADLFLPVSLTQPVSVSWSLSPALPLGGGSSGVCRAALQRWASFSPPPHTPLFPASSSQQAEVACFSPAPSPENPEPLPLPHPSVSSVPRTDSAAVAAATPPSPTPPPPQGPQDAVRDARQRERQRWDPWMDRQPLQSLEPGCFPPLGTLASKTDGACLLAPQRPPKCRNPAPLAQTRRRRQRVSAPPTRGAHPFPDVQEPHPRLDQTCRRQRLGTGWGVDAQMWQREGSAGVSPPWAACWPRPDCPAEGGAAGGGDPGGPRGCPLTPDPHLHSHVLPSDQPAPVCQHLLPDPDQ